MVLPSTYKVISRSISSRPMISSMTSSMMLDMANGISSEAGTGVSNEDRIVMAIVKALSELNLVYSVNIDGKELARATAPFMQNELDQIGTRTNRKLGFI